MEEKHEELSSASDISSKFENQDAVEERLNFILNGEPTTLSRVLDRVEAALEKKQEEVEVKMEDEEIVMGKNSIKDESQDQVQDTPTNQIGQEKIDKKTDSNEQQQQQQESSQSEEPAPQFDTSLGRNRRVRQKNRYFLDFHCVDLTKGARSSKDDYEAAFNAPTSTKRSATDTDQLLEDCPNVFVLRYCRKCSRQSLHSSDNQCQACLYNKIVESSKRHKPANQKNRSGGKSRQNVSELESSSATTKTSKRTKTNRQGGSRTANSNNNTNSNNKTNNSNNNHGNDNTTNDTTISNKNNNNGDNGATIETEDPPNSNSTSPTITTKSIVSVSSANINNIKTNENSNDSSSSNNSSINPNSGNNNNSISNINTDNTANKLPRLDSWTPEEVAEFITSKGFADEAELFKTESVDGISLLLMQRTDFTYGLKIKLGPALKIYDQVCKLKKEYFRTMHV